MTRVRLAVAGVLAVALGATVAAQAPEKQGFALKLEKDKPFYQKMKTEVTQVIKVQGQDLTQKQDSTFYFKWTPEKVEGDKATLKQRIEGLTMSIDISGNPITYDSTKKDAPGSAGNPGLMDFFKNLEGAEFGVTLNTKNWTVEKVDGKEEFVKKLGAGSAQMDSLLKKVLTDDALRQMADPTYGLVPDQPKAVGETWEKKQVLNLGPIGTYDVTYKMTYKGKDPTQKDLDRVEVVPTLAYKPPAEGTDGLLFKIKDGKMEAKPIDPADQLPPSVILYNPQTGRVVKATISLKLRGELTVVIGGTETKVELEQRQTTSIDSSNDPLLPGAAPAAPPGGAPPAPPKPPEKK
ncbi:MAG: hypothetical protein K2X87_02810 [Gemmataceae bacterium]|nr:hypothetical protein [Gemmataceae bacterium]